MLGVCDGHERADLIPVCYFGSLCWSWKNWFFYHLLPWQNLWWSWKNWFLTVSNLGVCGGLERADFLPFATLGVCGGHERTDVLPFATLGVWSGHWKNWFFINCYVGSLWWSWKNWFFTSLLMMGVGGSLEGADFSPSC